MSNAPAQHEFDSGTRRDDSSSLRRPESAAAAAPVRNGVSPTPMAEYRGVARRSSDTPSANDFSRRIEERGGRLSTYSGNENRPTFESESPSVPQRSGMRTQQSNTAEQPYSTMQRTPTIPAVVSQRLDNNSPPSLVGPGGNNFSRPIGARETAAHGIHVS